MICVGSGWAGSSSGRRRWRRAGATDSMAWVRLERTLASLAPRGGHAPRCGRSRCQVRGRAPCRARASSYSRHAAKSMSSAPSWSRTRRAGCRVRSAAAISSFRLRARWAGLGTARPRGVVGRVGHRPADRQLVAGEGAVGGANRHGETRGVGDGAGVGRRGRDPGRPRWREARAGCGVRVVQSMAVGDRVPQGDGAGRGRGRGRRWCRPLVASTTAPATRASGKRRRPATQNSGRRAGRDRDRCAVWTSSDLEDRRRGGSGAVTLLDWLSPEAAGPGSRCGHRIRTSSTARLRAPRPGLAVDDADGDLGVGLLVARGRGDGAVVDGEHGGHRLDGSGRGQAVAR